MATVATHIIWTTYGTWLPGDSRGHWSPLYDCYHQIRERGGRLNAADVLTHQIAAEKLAEPEKWLNASEISQVGSIVGELMLGSFSVYAAAIEPNHVHLLVSPLSEEIGRCVGRLKGCSSSEVLKLPGNESRRRVWTSGYWKVFLFDLEAVFAVKEYIDAHNLRRGLEAEPYPWITTPER